jgi:alpha-D-xyloside xylohydrolase
MRLHGDREPKQPQLGTTGGAECLSGASNEVWSYGETTYGICKKYMNIREGMREYTRSLMKEASEKGTPVMRTLFYAFPEDKECWEVEDQYMFGDKYLCCPVLEPGLRKREVYFPPGSKWESLGGDEEFNGGSIQIVDAPLDTMPVFVKKP